MCVCLFACVCVGVDVLDRELFVCLRVSLFACLFVCLRVRFVSLFCLFVFVWFP